MKKGRSPLRLRASGIVLSLVAIIYVVNDPRVPPHGSVAIIYVANDPQVTLYAPVAIIYVANDPQPPLYAPVKIIPVVITLHMPLCAPPFICQTYWYSQLPTLNPESISSQLILHRGNLHHDLHNQQALMQYFTMNPAKRFDMAH